MKAALPVLLAAAARTGFIASDLWLRGHEALGPRRNAKLVADLLAPLFGEECVGVTVPLRQLIDGVGDEAFLVTTSAHRTGGVQRLPQIFEEVLEVTVCWGNPPVLKKRLNLNAHVFEPKTGNRVHPTSEHDFGGCGAAGQERPKETEDGKFCICISNSERLLRCVADTQYFEA